MKKHNDIEQLFKDSFEHFEAPTKPELWSSIAQQIPAAGNVAAVSTGIPILSKIGLGTLVVGALSVVAYIGLKEEGAKKELASQQTEQVFEGGGKEIQEPNVQEERSSLLDNQEDSRSEDKPSVDVNTPEIKASNVKEERHTENLDNAVQLDNHPGNVIENQNKSPQQPVVPNTERVKETKPIQSGNMNAEPESILPPENIPDPVLSTEQVSAFLPDKLPNTFTPNGDGVNDYLQFEVKGVSYFKIEVFNVKGELVFVSQETDFRWDGMKMDGSPAPDGRYVYQVELRDEDGKPLKLRVQTLQIVRR